MIKKNIFCLFFLLLIFACGKKGDPIYKESQKKIEIQNISITKT